MSQLWITPSGEGPRGEVNWGDHSSPLSAGQAEEGGSEGGYWGMRAVLCVICDRFKLIRLTETVVQVWTKR